MSVLIFIDEVETKGGWHGEKLQLAFAKHQVKAEFASLKDCVLDFSGKTPSIKIPNLPHMPQAVFVRGIAGGTLQQITMRLNVLHMLKSLGVYVYNEGKAIERTVDKAMTSFLLHQHGISTPFTWACESRHEAHQIIQNHPKLVIKPLFGSQGQGVRLVDYQSFTAADGCVC